MRLRAHTNTGSEQAQDGEGQVRDRQAESDVEPGDEAASLCAERGTEYFHFGVLGS